MRTSEAFFLPFRSVLIVAEPDGKMLEVEPIVCKLDGKVRKLTLLRCKSVNFVVKKCQFHTVKVSIFQIETDTFFKFPSSPATPTAGFETISCRYSRFFRMGLFDMRGNGVSLRFGKW